MNNYIVHTSEGERSVSLSHCNCTFNTAMSLPCRHMFALRAMLEKPLFDENLCEKRWTLTYYRVASEASHVHFQRRLDLLGDFISQWKSAHEVTITEVTITEVVTGM